MGIVQLNHIGDHKASQILFATNGRPLEQEYVHTIPMWQYRNVLRQGIKSSNRIFYKNHH
jgi:hypothetical protein